MSSTRYAPEGAPLSQERYASSPAYEQGLLANMVAKRCTVLTDPRGRKTVWFLQHLSWQPGGLKKAAAELLAMFPDRLEVPAVAKEIENRRKSANRRSEDAAIARSLSEDPYWKAIAGESDLEPLGEKELMAKALLECRSRAATLPELLTSYCLNPQANLSCDYFHDLRGALREYQTALASRHGAGADTAQSRIVFENLDYALSARCMTLVTGPCRVGKSHAARAFTDSHPGSVRYVLVPPGNDDMGFYRAIAKALGVATCQKSKAQELRLRIEETLDGGDLMLLLDDSANLLPQSVYRDSLPPRVKWIVSIIEKGERNCRPVSIGLVATPEIWRMLTAVSARTGMDPVEFTGRIDKLDELSPAFTDEELAAVARNHAPEMCATSVQALVDYSKASAKHLAGIVDSIRRARYLAGKAGRERIERADLREAIKGSAIPTQKAVTEAIAGAQRTGRRCPAPLPQPARRAAATPPQSVGTRANLPAEKAEESFLDTVARRETAPAPVEGQ